MMTNPRQLTASRPAPATFAGPPRLPLRRPSRSRLLRLLLVLALVASAPASAEVEAASSFAFGQQVDVLASPLLGVDSLISSGPAPIADGVAPPDFEEQRMSHQIAVGGGFLSNMLTCQSMTVTARADGSIVEAISEVDDLDVQLNALLHAGANSIVATARLRDTGGEQPEVTADVLISGGSISGPLWNQPIDERPPPNTVLDDPSGLRITLNAQSLETHGTSTTLKVTAMIIEMDDVLMTGAGTAFGRIEIGHAQVTMSLEPLVVDPCGGFDADGDGVCDGDDNCPNTANPGQQDSDDDGIGDACDGPSDPCGGFDADGDGICDEGDNCPFDANPDQADADGDGEGDACEQPDDPCPETGDSDDDGVCDGIDNCPNAPNPSQQDSDGDGLGDACDGGGGGGGEPEPTLPQLGVDAACRVGVQPAASLLVPHFAVDMDDPDGESTLLGVVNTSVEPTLAKVTLWTDWAVPTLSFEIYLAGLDVVTFNLRQILADGVLPKTGPSLAHHGELSMPNHSFPGCGDPLASSLTANQRRQIAAWHRGFESPIDGTCAGQPRPGSSLAVGYVTVDVVSRCSTLDPADADYFARGANRVAAERNVLLGDVFQVEPRNDFASGSAAVHLVADRARFGAGDATFYGRYVGKSGRDGRQPLPRVFASRFLAGGAFDGGTQITVWRDTRSTASRPRACGSRPAWHPLGSRPTFVWDEDSRTTVLDAGDHRFPLATQRLKVGEGSLPVDSAFGWLMLDLGVDDGGQGWLDVKLDAMGRFSVGYAAAGIAASCPQ